MRHRNITIFAVGRRVHRLGVVFYVLALAGLVWAARASFSNATVKNTHATTCLFMSASPERPIYRNDMWPSFAESSIIFADAEAEDFEYPELRGLLIDHCAFSSDSHNRTQPCGERIPGDTWIVSQHRARAPPRSHSA